MIYFFENLKNNIDFFMRCHITFSRKNYSEVFKEPDLNEEQRSVLEKLSKSYNLNLLKNTSKRVYLESLYYLGLFEKTFSKSSCNQTSILDIGSKNWSYAGCEHIFFNSFLNNFNLVGIELDAFRLNSNFYSRYEIAKYYIKNLADAKYIAGDFLSHKEKYDYIIWILPFIIKYPLVKWGLPLKYFKPYEMLSHAYNLLNDGGQLLIINQGEEEYLIQQKLNKELNLNCKYFGEIEDKFDLFKNKRYCSLILK